MTDLKHRFKSAPDNKNTKGKFRKRKREKDFRRDMRVDKWIRVSDRERTIRTRKTEPSEEEGRSKCEAGLGPRRRESYENVAREREEKVDGTRKNIF
jgi:hypothetical protein